MFSMFCRPTLIIFLDLKKFQEAMAKAKEANEASIKAGNADVPEVKYPRDLE